MNCPKNRDSAHTLKLRFAALPKSKQNKFSASAQTKDLRKEKLKSNDGKPQLQALREAKCGR